LRERVVCDGRELLHVYPQLGLAARRDYSRFHRAELAEFVPWLVLDADEMARGADLRLVDEKTVAVVPHGADKLPKTADGKEMSYVRVHLVFADGRLAERQLVQMPKGEVVVQQLLTADGTLRWLDGK